MCFTAPDGPPVNTPAYSLDQSHTAVEFDNGRAKDQPKAAQARAPETKIKEPEPMKSAAGLYAPALKM